MSKQNIREAVPDDAELIVDYKNIVGGESENLTFGKGQYGVSVKTEKDTIYKMQQAGRSTMLLCFIDGELASIASVSGMEREWLSHRAIVAITVRKKFWGRRLGTLMMEKLIDFSREAGLEVLELSVRVDNHAAVHLYQKMGFVILGTYKRAMKIENRYYDTYLMNLYL